jgi:hypothetical protein
MNINYVYAFIALVVMVSIIVFATSSSKTNELERRLSLTEGQSVTCDDGTGMVYRYTGGKLRYYPNPPIALSWNPSGFANIRSLTAEDCATIPRGDNMSFKS